VTSAEVQGRPLAEAVFFRQRVFWGMGKKEKGLQTTVFTTIPTDFYSPLVMNLVRPFKPKTGPTV
jgi:hypothetical protein